MSKNKNTSKIGDSCNFFGFEPEKSKEEEKSMVIDYNDFKKSGGKDLFEEVEDSQKNSDRRERKIAVISFYMLFTVSCLCFYLAITLSGIASMGCLLMWVLLSKLSTTQSVIAYKLKFGRNVTIKDWFNNKKEWFPKF